MAIGGKPTAEYVMDSLMANLKLISDASSPFGTNVKTIKMPAYRPHSDAMFGEECPAILVWVDGEMTAPGMLGRPERILDVWIYGIVKGSVSIQAQLVRLEANIRQCLLSNQQLAYPGTDGDPPGRGLEESPDAVSYQINEGDQSKSSGVLVSRWRIRYAYPFPNG